MRGQVSESDRTPWQLAGGLASLAAHGLALTLWLAPAGERRDLGIAPTQTLSLVPQPEAAVANGVPAEALPEIVEPVPPAELAEEATPLTELAAAPNVEEQPAAEEKDGTTTQPAGGAAETAQNEPALTAEPQAGETASAQDTAPALPLITARAADMVETAPQPTPEGASVAPEATSAAATAEPTPKVPPLPSRRTANSSVPRATAPRGRVSATPPERAARRASSGPAGTNGAAAIASFAEMSRYVALVRARIAARASGLSAPGSAMVAFRVTAAGGVAGARLSRSSGSSTADAAALAAVRRAAPFPPPPRGSGPIDFNLPFAFR